MMQMLRKHLHLSVVLFDQLRCYLTHRIGVVRRTPARFRPECTIAVIPQVIGGINHFSQMPHWMPCIFTSGKLYGTLLIKHGCSP